MENIKLFLCSLCLSSFLVLLFIFILTIVIREIIELKEMLDNKGE